MGCCIASKPENTNKCRVGCERTTVDDINPALPIIRNKP